VDKEVKDQTGADHRSIIFLRGTVTDMALGNYPLRDVGAIPQSFNKPWHKVWLWQVESGAFECPLEPLTRSFGLSA